MPISTTCSLAALERGYDRAGDPPEYRCLTCDARFEQGLVYPDGDTLRDAERAARHHVAEAHGGPLRALLALGDDGHGLPPVLARVLELTASGRSDRAIAAELGGRSVSTVRNHRFQLRKRHRQARVLVALMELLDRGADRDGAFVEFHDALPVADERTAITEAEAAALLDRYFADPDRSRLLRFPKKEKHKLVILRQLASTLEPERRYTETELNAHLGAVFDDHTTLRRYLVDYRFLARTRDGRAYWRIDG